MTEQHFFLTNGDDAPLNQKAVYFIWMTDDGIAVNLNDDDGDVIFGEISPNILG